MSKLRTLSLIAVFLAFFGTAGAQNLKMDGINAANADSRPTRGMSQTSVQSKFGSPAAVKSPVGDPPITRWEYQNFIVYFEYDKVIHSVARR